MTASRLPQRTCIGCGQIKDKKDLIRIVKSKEDITVDVTRKADGRGAYICPNMDCLNLAIKKRGLERSFKMKLENDVYESIKVKFNEFYK